MGSDSPPDTPGKPVDKSYYGSASRRAGRNLKKSNDIPPFRLPQSFLHSNVILKEILQTRDHNLPRNIVPIDTSLDRAGIEAVRKAAGEKLQDGMRMDGAKSDWKIDARVLQEVESTVLAGLQTPIYQLADSTISAKPHVVLHCPKKGGIAFLDVLVKHLASKTGSDLIQLDAQDLAELGGDYLDDFPESESESLSSLSYDIHTVDQNIQDRANKTIANNSAVGAEDPNASNQTSIPQGVNVVPVNAKLLQDMLDLFKAKSAPDSHQQQARHSPQVVATVAIDSMRDQKLALVFNELFNACSSKRAMISGGDKSSEATDAIKGPFKGKITDERFSTVQSHQNNAPSSSPTLILHINDYPEIFNNSSGGKLMDALHATLHERRTGGERILLVGTCASDTDDLALSRLDHDNLLHEFDTGPTRTLLVPPFSDRGSDELFSHHHKQRIQSINIRHLRDMFRRLASDHERTTEELLGSSFHANAAEVFGSEIQKHIWSSDHVHRTVTIALGTMQADNQVLTSNDIKRALEIIEASDNAKHAWLSNEKEKARSASTANKGQGGRSQNVSPKRDRKQLEKECNAHEKRLLRGMVDPSEIRTTFDQVHAPKEMIQTLKDVTLLPLACPNEFEYGVLAEQNISGILLYGPPGTGKTLLAKAVANEGGATILEISGADLYNKWVGEGEKNVKAMFSLARKLKPCIVFIDEADGILGGRGNDNGRPSHRDLINQFLREWDGMKETTALIMVATNRPFDLDDAVVRRLPRRMLVDLPTEKDREEILKIHLQKEILDPEVSLAKLAADTPLYSGSDLKHLVVTAAQACVRENFDAATAKLENSSKPVNPVQLDSSTPSASSSLPSMPIPPPPPIQPPLPSEAPLQANSPSEPSTSERFVGSNWHDSLPSKLKAFIPPNPFAILKSVPPASSSSKEEVPTFLTETIAASTSAASSPQSELSPSTTPISTQTSSSSSISPSTPSSPPAPLPPSTSPSLENNTRRILRPRHFAQALGEISASVSEDMSSLNAIKKFDEKYGDRKGRKKKLDGGYGFGTLGEGEREKVKESGARVR